MIVYLCINRMKSMRLMQACFCFFLNLLNKTCRFCRLCYPISMWLFLWILFVLTIIGIFAWSFHVIHEQKRAWQAFAVKYHLQYIKGALFQPPAITGQLKDRMVNIYVQQNTQSEQGRKSATMIEVFLTKIPVSVALVASQGFGDLAAQAQLPEPFNVEDSDWPKNIIARAPDDRMAQIWFSAHKNRVRAIQKLMKIPNDTAFVITEDNAFVVFRTPEPLSDPRLLNKIIIELFEVASMLETEADPETQLPEDQAPLKTEGSDNQVQQTEIENPNEPSDSEPLSSKDEPNS